MLPKKNRLTKKKDFDKVFSQGRSVYSGPLGLKFLPNNQENNRFGFLVSTKVSKLAVDRNRLKRQLRAIIDICDSDLKQGHDCVFMTKLGAIDLSFGDLEATVKKLLKSGRLI